MSKGIEQIGRKDVVWSFFSTFFLIGSNIILLPLILHEMPAAMVAVWSIFQVISGLVHLLDFGFRPSFARNVSYIFSGVQRLQVEGVASDVVQGDVNYTLLKTALHAMRSFYKWMALSVLIMMLIIGSIYIYLVIIPKYSESHTDLLLAWMMLIAVNCYNLYTLYYDALLLGKGYVKQSQQITTLGQVLYLLVSVVLILLGCGLTAIVSAQFVSVFVRRILSYKVFFKKDLVVQLSKVQEENYSEVLHVISPNAVKVGLTNLGGFLVNRSSVLIGSAFLTLEEVACYSITFQVIEVIALCSTVYFQANVPKIAEFRANRNLSQLRRLFKNSIILMLLVYIIFGGIFLLLGNYVMQLLQSDTKFLTITLSSVLLIISLLEHNHSIAAGFIAADNRIPFFIPSILSGVATVVLLWLFMSQMNMGLWGMILAPGLAQLAYQNWKWPELVIKELYCK
jgi:O-antigen/teichoic acid export membrane protein